MNSFNNLRAFIWNFLTWVNAPNAWWKILGDRPVYFGKCRVIGPYTSATYQLYHYRSPDNIYPDHSGKPLQGPLLSDDSFYSEENMFLGL